jgi:flagellar hook-length control protein FliK
MIRAQQAPTAFQPSKAISPFMTVPASSVPAVLPGAPLPFSGTAAGASTTDGGLFGGLLAGVMGVGQSTGSPRPKVGDNGAAPATAPADESQDALDPGLAEMLAALGMAPATVAPTPIPTARSGDTADGALAAGGRTRFFEGQTPVLTAINARADRASTEIAGVEPAEGQATTTIGEPRAPHILQTAQRGRDLTDGLSPVRASRPEVQAAPTPTPAASLPSVAAPVAPPPATAQAAAPAVLVAAAAPAVEAEATVETPPAPGLLKTAASEGEGRRANAAGRHDRRDGSGRAAAAVSPFAPRAESPAALAAAAAADPEFNASGEAAPDPLVGDLSSAPEAPSPAVPAETRAPSIQSAGQIAEATPRSAPETVARLAADIVRKVDGQSTRFDLQLDPHGMGKVDVAIEIDKDGKLTAALSFDSAQSASDLRGRAGELRLALEQAGFDVAEGGLTFDLSGQTAGFGGREADQQERAWNGRAFQRVQSGLEDADLALADTPSTASRWTRSGVDIRI